MAKYTYKGTKIKGTSTTAKAFPKSKVTAAKVGDTYFNKSTGHVYQCTVKGGPKVAKWKYVRTDIVAKPDTAVSSLTAPARQSGNRKMKATWKVPATLTNAKNGDRAQGLKIWWTLGCDGADPKQFIDDKTESHTSSTIDLNAFKTSGKTYTRANFYPRTSKKMYWISAKVVPYNSKGNGSKSVTKTANFQIPRAPTIAGPSFNPDTGVLSATISTNAGADLYERYDTRYKATVHLANGKTQVIANTSSTSTSIPITYNVANYQALNFSQYVRLTVEAWSRGYRGDSAHVKKQYTVAYPAQVQINEKGIRVWSGKCTIPISVKPTLEHPVDQIRLEYLANVEYATSGAIPGDAGWEISDIVDDGKCTAMTVSTANLIPERGHYTWVRIKSYHGSEAVLFRHSNYVRIKALETPAATAADERITIISTSPGTDGQSVVVQLGWNKNGADDATGTELTWSESSDAWKSTKDPDEYRFTWSDGQKTAGGVTYRDSAKITIKDLEEGTKYYIRARRYMEGDVETYSPYSNIATCLTTETPEAIVATCDRYIPVGKSLPVYWTFSGNGIQKEWQIVTTNNKVVMKGTGSIGATQIAADRLASLATNNSLSFTVQASTGSGFVVSETHTVTIIDNPTLALAVATPLTVQPFSFGATVSTPCDLIVIVSSNGIGGQFPDGLRNQTAGDTVHSGIYSPAWVENEQTNLWSATVTLPPGLDFWDGGNYTLTVTAVDRTTSLQSTEQTATFGILWAHQAPDPTEYVTLTPIDVEDDENDAHHQAVQIALTPPAACYVATTDTEVVTGKTYYAYVDEAYVPVTPAGSENPSEQGWFELNGDLYDIYRKTGDGAVLIGESFPLSFTTTDEYAPYGEDLPLHYRIAIRTTDGDVAFGDIEYEAPGTHMRFDWAGGSLELPYDITIGDQYEKDIELRQHMDGSTDGYWNQNIKRSASLKSNLIFLDQQPEIESARSLARYPGAVFVRLPDGSAYEADVQVSDLSSDGTLTKIAIDATEIGLTDEFILPSPYTFEEDSGESGASGESGTSQGG